MGKIIGGLIGWFTFGPFAFIGAILGVFAGHMFDKGRASLKQSLNPEERARIEHAFFHALFPALGYLAKADGKVSQDEINVTEVLIQRMGLDTARRAEAISLFQQGKSDGFQLDAALNELVQVLKNRSDLKKTYLNYLLNLALADGVLADGEVAVLKQISEQLGFSSFVFNQLLNMVKAQMAFQQQQRGSAHGGSYQQHGAPTRADELLLAYQVLGQDSHVSDDELKRSYRKLMSENHPDKLAGQGLPDDVIRDATERSQEIQAAYELIKKSRK